MPRATPLPPEERRASILAAARPLLAEHGPALTTRQVADAAGIAEGTLFRIFPTKSDLLHALVEQALDPAPTIAQIQALPAEQTLPERAEALVALLTSGIERVSEVFTALRTAHHEAPRGEGHRHGPPPGHGERAHALRTALTASLAPYAAQLTTSPEVAARLLHVVSFSTAHPLLNQGERLDPAALARIMLTGLAKENPC